MAEEKKLTRAEKKAKKREAKEQKKKQLVLFRAKKNGKHVSRWMNLYRVFAYPIHSLIYPFKLHGHKKVGKGACVYVGNHYCLWDIFYPAHTTWEGIHFLAKQSILEAPVLGGLARKVGVIGAMRDGSDVRTVMNAMKALKHGDKISIFPEGTRNKEGDGEEFLPFHGGAALFAIKTKTPIVPLVICNKPRPFHRTHVVFGEPFELTEYYDRKLTQADYDEADEKIKNILYDMRAKFREERAAKKNKKKKKGKQ